MYSGNFFVTKYTFLLELNYKVTFQGLWPKFTLTENKLETVIAERLNVDSNRTQQWFAYRDQYLFQTLKTMEQRLCKTGLNASFLCFVFVSIGNKCGVFLVSKIMTSLTLFWCLYCQPCYQYNSVFLSNT